MTPFMPISSARRAAWRNTRSRASKMTHGSSGISSPMSPTGTGSPSGCSPRRAICRPSSGRWRQLEQRYQNVAALNAAWGTSAESFAQLRWPFEHDQTPTGAAARDMRELRGEFAQRWCRIWAKAIRAADPHHLLLGSRIHLGDKYPEVIAACAPYVDVMSLNHYRHGPDVAMLERLYAIAQKPIFIGEYGHNSLDEGLLTTAVPVASAAERGTGFRYYTEQLAALPYVIGGHYFQYWDEPITGRFDSETAYNGFVNVADIASKPLVAAARATNARIYAVHAGVEAPFAVAPRKP